jgi:hypothetical protein
MAKKKETFMQSARSTWLKLSLELIAVFVGISAGFFMNNFQEDRRDRELEHKYLESFHKNLVADSIEIHRHMEEDQNNLDRSRRAAIAMTSTILPEDSARALLAVVATFNNLNMKNATYTSIVNSGNLGLIRDWSLREDLVNYYSYQQSIRDVEVVYNEYINNYVMPFLFKNLDLLSGEFAEDFRTDSREFKNMTTGYYILADQRMEMLMEVDSVNHALIPKVRLVLENL